MSPTRLILLIILAALLLAAGLLYWAARPPPVLTVMSWAGAYGRAQANAMMRPYAAKSGANVRLAQWDGDLDTLARAIVRNSYDADVIDFELPKAVEACARGLLERLDHAGLPPGADGAPASRDFVTGALGPCWVGSVIYSQVMIYTAGRFGENHPTRLSDFFDLAKFPGRRALKRGSPKFNLEMALLADGAAPGEIYKLLGTEAGLARAFAKLDSIQSVTVWADTSAQVLALVQSGQAAFGTALNGDIFQAAQHGAAPAIAPGIIWDHQLYEMDVFGIPRGDPKAGMARDFISFATGTTPLAQVADWVPYGPARRSSLVQVGKNPETGIAMKPWLPTIDFTTAFAVDDAWWLANGPRMAARWRAWLGQRIDRSGGLR